jgi:hypothetical protein
MVIMAVFLREQNLSYNIFTGLLQQMKKQMEQELKKQNDPRMFGKGDVFDKYPHAKPEMQNYYDRYIKGERVRKRTGADVD